MCNCIGVLLEQHRRYSLHSQNFPESYFVIILVVLFRYVLLHVQYVLLQVHYVPIRPICTLGVGVFDL
jgi:hypothetical protein